METLQKGDWVLVSEGFAKGCIGVVEAGDHGTGLCIVRSEYVTPESGCEAGDVVEAYTKRITKLPKIEVGQRWKFGDDTPNEDIRSFVCTVTDESGEWVEYVCPEYSEKTGSCRQLGYGSSTATFYRYATLVSQATPTTQPCAHCNATGELMPLLFGMPYPCTVCKGTKVVCL